MCTISTILFVNWFVFGLSYKCEALFTFVNKESSFGLCYSWNSWIIANALSQIPSSLFVAAALSLFVFSVRCWLIQWIFFSSFSSYAMYYLIYNSCPRAKTWANECIFLSEFLEYLHSWIVHRSSVATKLLGDANHHHDVCDFWVRYLDVIISFIFSYSSLSLPFILLLLFTHNSSFKQ